MARQQLVRRARNLRRLGKSHRDIAHTLNIGLGSSFLYTQGIRLTKSQHLKLMKRGILKTRKLIPKEILREAYKRGGLNTPTKFKTKYSKAQLINILRDFKKKYKRIPTKREFYNRWQPFRRIFGSWNRAIVAAGFIPNPVLFAQKWTAKDGHRCDSLSEKIIDDILYKNAIYHERSLYYPDQKKFTVDFLIDHRIWLEFFGLKGVIRKYDELVKRKYLLARTNNIEIIKITPEDLFPVKDLEERIIALVNQK